ncbi:prolyl oligopeptidase family serine peptidase [uncultured Eudoraea sp.]|uniref:prolyl oligopeptidase family serine peptidase n=1 Tax=uncultured Eudoraea sp. TaxID=1035614 RepID=UPI00260E0892|nr:prolyl oligopeptidase family serine peptidase [uncultured Eudoraea sp.]
MRHYFLLTFIIVFIWSCKQDKQRSFEYPTITNIKKTEEHFGIPYTNEFGNLENLKDSTVLNWYRGQDAVAEAYFSNNEEYDELYKHYDSLENRESDPAGNIRYSEDGQVFYLSELNKEDQKYLFRKGTNSADPENLYDPSTYSDGTFEVEYLKPSYDGKYVALAMGKPENFFNDIIILDCTTKHIIGNPIKNAKPEKAGGIVWTPDNSSILYIAYPNNGPEQNDRNSFTALYNLKKPNEEPKVVFKDGLSGISVNEEYYPLPKFRSMKDNYIFIYLANASDYWDCYYLPTEDFLQGNYNWKLLFKEQEKILYDYGKERDHIFYYLRENGDNIELCSSDLKNPDFSDPKILARGKGENQIQNLAVLKNEIFYTISTNGISEVLYKYESDKAPEKMELPFSSGDVSLNWLSPYESELWITLSGWTANSKTYYRNANNEFEFVELGMWPSYPEFSNIISEVVEVTSHDGTKVPLSIVRRSDHEFNQGAKGIITAYGAYGMSETPWFHEAIIDFVSQGNIYATAHVRGGGEKGPAWHKAGMKSTKENSWKDLNACSEYLIKNGYIGAKKLGLNVNSAGAITGAMAINERPDLYKVFTGFAPTLNVIRVEYIEEIDDSDSAFEFGTITELESYKDLLKMDPVVNLSNTIDYPSTLLIIGFRDYLISPSAPGKYIALLQSFNSANDKPYLLDVKFDAEHEIDWVDDFARMLYFTDKELDK